MIIINEFDATKTYGEYDFILAVYENNYYKELVSMLINNGYHVGGGNEVQRVTIDTEAIMDVERYVDRARKLIEEF